MNKWKVTGCRTQRVFCYVEADNEDEAWEKADEQCGDDVTTWKVDEEANYYEAEPNILNVEEVDEC